MSAQVCNMQVKKVASVSCSFERNDSRGPRYWRQTMKRVLILVAISLFVCSTASAFQSGGGESTKNGSSKTRVVTKKKTSGTKSAKTASQKLSSVDLVLAKLFNGNGFVHSVTFSPNEKLLAVDGSNGQGKGEVNIYDIMTGEKLKSFDVYGYTRSIAFSPDGNLFAIAADDVGTVIYNSNTGKPIKSLKGKTNVNRISFSKDGDYLGVAALYEAYIYDVKTFEQLVFFKTKSHDSQISFDPNGKSFLITNSEGIFRYGLPTGNLLNSSTPNWRLVNSASLSPNGKVLAIGTLDSTILYDIAKNKPTKLYDGFTDCVGFSPNGDFLVITTEAKGAMIFSIQTGQKVKSISNKVEGGTYVAQFSAKGNYLAINGNRKALLYGVKWVRTP